MTPKEKSESECQVVHEVAISMKKVHQLGKSAGIGALFEAIPALVTEDDSLDDLLQENQTLQGKLAQMAETEATPEPKEEWKRMLILDRDDGH